MHVVNCKLHACAHCLITVHARIHKFQVSVLLHSLYFNMAGVHSVVALIMLQAVIYYIVTMIRSLLQYSKSLPATLSNHPY